MNWLRKMMMGRHGSDQLNMGLLILAIILMVISAFVPTPVFSIASLAVLGFSFFRMFSKNIGKRQQENMKFMQGIYKIKGFFTGAKGRAEDRKTHKYYTCPQCKQKLRVPRGKGTIKISCPKCKTSFSKRT